MRESAELIDLSVVVPVHDEADNVGPLYEETVAVLGPLEQRWELVLVDDGSRDDTFARARELARRDHRVRVVKLTRNYGQTAALQAGLDHAGGQIIVTMDGDLENDPRDIPRMLAVLEEGYDVVCGWRKDRQGSFWTRRAPSWVANRLIGLLTGVKVHDTGCCLRAHRRRVAEQAHLYSDMHRYMPVILERSGFYHTEIVVNHRLRRFGRSKYGLGRIWKVGLDLISLAMISRFSFQPAQWFIMLGLPFLFLTVVFAAGAGYLYLTADSAEGFPVVLPAAAVLFAFSFLQLQIMALLGELVLWSGDEEVVESFRDSEEESR